MDFSFFLNILLRPQNTLSINEFKAQIVHKIGCVRLLRSTINGTNHTLILNCITCTIKGTNDKNVSLVPLMVQVVQKYVICTYY